MSENKQAQAEEIKLTLDPEAEEQEAQKEEQAEETVVEKNPIDENLKNTDTLKWFGLMNNYKHLVEEIIFNELINC